MTHKVEDDVEDVEVSGLNFTSALKLGRRYIMMQMNINVSSIIFCFPRLRHDNMLHSIQNIIQPRSPDPSEKGYLVVEGKAMICTLGGKFFISWEGI